MQFLTSLFGGSQNSWLTALFALGVVVVLILIVAWVLKFFVGTGANAGRNRNRRMSVVETMVIDSKRQLMLIRRDDVEHLILIGGPQDVVVEAGIAPEEEVAQPQTTRRPVPMVPARRPAPAAPAPAVAPAAPVAPTPKGAPGTVLEALQQAGHSGDRKAHLSLRNTGLLRPGKPVSAENAATAPAESRDSVKEGASPEVESTDIAGNNEANRI